MGQKAPYKTRQQALVVEYLAALDGRHTTVAQMEHALGGAVGTATLYRQLEKLEQRGLVRRYALEGEAGTCYEYLPAGECRGHLHLKCEGCGALVHLDCEQAGHFQAHIQSDHGFEVNRTKTVLYGLCADCRAARGEQPGR